MASRLHSERKKRSAEREAFIARTHRRSSKGRLRREAVDDDDGDADQCVINEIGGIDAGPLQIRSRRQRCSRRNRMRRLRCSVFFLLRNASRAIAKRRPRDSPIISAPLHLRDICVAIRARSLQFFSSARSRESETTREGRKGSRGICFRRPRTPRRLFFQVSSFSLSLSLVAKHKSASRFIVTLFAGRGCCRYSPVTYVLLSFAFRERSRREIRERIPL